MNSLSPRQIVGLLTLLIAAGTVALLCLLIDRTPEGVIGLAWPERSFAWVRYTVLAEGAIVGAALAISGVLLQALLRNPLAAPSILGVSSGAGLGVMVALYISYAVRGSEHIIRGGT